MHKMDIKQTPKQFLVESLTWMILNEVPNDIKQIFKRLQENFLYALPFEGTNLIMIM